MTSNGGLSEEHKAPPGVDAGEVRAWAKNFAKQAPSMRTETARMIGGMLRRTSTPTKADEAA